MSNPTELPDLDKLEALMVSADNLSPASSIELAIAIREALPALIAAARRAQPESEAPQADITRETIQRLAELHFYEGGAASMDIRLYRFAAALIARTRPAASIKQHEAREYARAALAAQQAAAPVWGPVHSVGDMVRNMLTLEQAAPIFTAFHVTIDGQRRCRTRGVTISKERVIDGKWIDSARKDVPYTHIIWAKPDERAPSAPGTPEAPADLPRLYRFDCYVGKTKMAAGVGVHASTMEEAEQKARKMIDKEETIKFESNQPCHATRKCGICAAYERAAQLDGGQEGSD